MIQAETQVLLNWKSTVYLVLLFVHLFTYNLLAGSDTYLNDWSKTEHKSYTYTKINPKYILDLNVNIVP